MSDKVKNRLKIIILENNYTIRELSKIVGINEQTLSNWCNNRNIDNILKFAKLCSILNTTPDQIFPNIKKD